MDKLAYKKYINETVNKKYLHQQFKIFKHHKVAAKNDLNLFRKELSKNKISKTDTEYLKFFYEMLHKVDFNIAKLAQGIQKLSKPNDLMASMFLFRGQLELVFFNIFLTHKLKIYLNKKNYKDLIHLSCRANLASGSDSVKLDMISEESFILSKIIKKFRNKRIHINDCIRFYKKTDFSKILFTDYEVGRKLGEELFSRDYKIEADMVISAYDRLCEVIHPTALMINDSQDKKTLLDYKEILLKICTSTFFFINICCFKMKSEIFREILKNKNNLIKSFKETLK
jgi:hypothetical protein